MGDYDNLTADDMEVGLQVAEVGLGTVDYVADTVRLDALSAALFDLPMGEDIPRGDLHGRIHPDDWSQVAPEVDILLDPNAPDVINVTHRILQLDGTVKWVNARKQVRFDGTRAGARPATGVFALVDITARKQAEQQAQMLIGELHHRSKNLITVISGIARQLGRHTSPEAFPERLQARLGALARNQDAIVGDAEGRFDMRAVFDRQLDPFDTARRSRVELRGPSLTISGSSAQTFAMILHELLTNAVKYGALSNGGGRVSVTWAIAQGGRMLSMSWREQGGPPVTPPARTGFGTQVLTDLARMALSAEITLDHRADGLRFDLNAPLEHVV